MRRMEQVGSGKGGEIGRYCGGGGEQKSRVGQRSRTVDMCGA